MHTHKHERERERDFFGTSREMNMSGNPKSK